VRETRDPTPIARGIAPPAHRLARSTRFRLVRLSVRKFAVAFLAAPILLACLDTAPSTAAIPFGPCPNSNTFACGHLTVPVDPSGTVPGTITLAVHRRLAPVGNPKSAVIALAGGPGQSAIPFAEYFTEVLGSILSTRDLIVYDQRGTGLSHPLSCHSFEHPRSYHSLGALITTCANQLGATRGLYTTADSVADIEAIRQAGGYEKLVLYGTSYGTKVALQYAQEYPQHVEALILDSVVPANGPEPLNRPTFAAIPRILRQLCAFHECAGITPNPVRDLARLVRRMRHGPITGRVIDGHGDPHTVRISSEDLIGILLGGDFDPILRAEFISAVRAAADGDDAALARLLVHAEGGGSSEQSEDIDAPLYYATTCEDEAFPWNRAASPKMRIAEAATQIDALPASSIAPFTSANVLGFSDLLACAFWPFASPAPPLENAPLPDVPTLLLSGADDLRTPTSNARAVAEQIPDAHLLVVPNTGHSVLSTEPTSCARNALKAMFAGRPIAPCAYAPPALLLRPTPLPPARLSNVAPAHGYRGRAGRTLHAVTLTLTDFTRQFVLQALEAIGSTKTTAPPTLRSGGLRAGWAEFAGGGLRFHDYSYIAGVTISGTVKSASVALRVGGSSAAHGTLHLGPHKELVGILGGRRVHIAASHSATLAQAARNTTGASSLTDAPSTQPQDALDRLPAGLGEDFAELLQATPVRAEL
jgi:pimeloyl-ACP methyl ester carboxylesterase